MNIDTPSAYLQFTDSYVPNLLSPTDSVAVPV